MFNVFIAKVWAKVWPYIAGVAGIIAGLFFVRQSGKAAGRQEADKTKLEAQVRAQEESREAAAEIERLDDTAVRDRARTRMRKSSR